MNESTRSTKKQRELLSFIDGFIKGNGYGPSYREVMRALEYKSVSTVATHIDGLIARGYLRKKTHSARTLEVVAQGDTPHRQPTTAATTEAETLKVALARRIASLQQEATDEQQQKVAILQQAARILEIDLDDTDTA